jgi:uncharacterized membrane-anchored protein
VPIIAAIISTVGTFIGGVFQFKGDQAKTVQSALTTLQGLNDNEAQSVVAQAQAISAILNQGSFLERNWRAVFMCILMAILVSAFFGFVPPHFNDKLSPMLERIFSLLEIGLGGYIVRYGLRDMIREFNIASILKEIISKKVL